MNNVNIEKIDMKEVEKKNDSKQRVYPTFHESFRFIIILGQCFALMPLNGLKDPTPNKLRFKFISWKTFHTLFVLIATSFSIVVGSIHWYDTQRMDNLEEYIFYIIAAARLILFWHLAYKWPKLVDEWCKVDVAMEKNYGYPKSVDKKLRTITFAVIILATIEYDFSIGFHITSCKQNYGYINGSAYYQNVFPQIFNQVPFSFWTAAIVQFVSISSTFIWNYNDLFIMLISTAMALRFKQINDRLIKYETKNTTLDFWVEIHEDYDRLCILCKHLDEALSLIVFQSFAVNLLYILFQLYNTLRPVRDTMETVYFYYSFAFLIFRTVAVSLYAAWINDESKEPTAILNSVPSHVYNNEIRRFLLQISFDNVALTGSKMFKVTRGLILHIAGAIVTYELVLVQFKGHPSMK